MKKFLFGLIIAFFGLCSFSNAGMITRHLSSVYYSNVRVNTNYGFVVPIGYLTPGYYNLDVCVYNLTDYSNYKLSVPYMYQNQLQGRHNVSITSSDFCTTINNNWESNIMYYVGITPASQFTVNGFLFSNDVYFTVSGANITGECPTCQECQECEECQECQSCPTTGDVLSQYCDINYCVSNNLCPVSGSGFEWSALFINNIQFPGHDVINISIPDYIQWDYTSSTGLFDLSVGSGYDQDYIDSVLKINSYRPDSKDFTQIFVSGLTLIFPYIFVALLIMFIWKLLKRIFK